MLYETSWALRMALEQRLRIRSDETGVGLDRLRRRVIFERIVARLQTAEPGRWVLKGGMALEVRLRDDARLTKDIDLGLRDEVTGPDELHERLVDALTADPHGDGFWIVAARPRPIGDDGTGHLTWRASVSTELAGKHFGSIQLDVSSRSHELDTTDRVPIPNSLDFADVPVTIFEIIDVHRHAAEKFHAMLRDFGERENSRVRDLVDLVILIEHGLLDPPSAATATRAVWAEREVTEPPETLPVLPQTWPHRYERHAADHDLRARSFAAARALVDRLWAEMFLA